LERDGNGHLAEGGLTRLFERKRGVDAELSAQTVPEGRMDGLFQIVEHGNLSIRRASP
jgi:hypothetical protein